MLGKYCKKINERKNLFCLFCIKILILYLFFDLNFKYKQFQEINEYLFKNLKLEAKTESNIFTIKNPNNATQILSELSYKIKVFNNALLGDHFYEPCASVILKYFFNISENGFSNPIRSSNQFQTYGYIIANLITLTSILISFPSIILLASNDWKKRLFACFAYQLKNILDYIDGPIIRNYSASNVTTSFNLGRFLDGLGSGLSFFFFFIGSCIYVFRSLDLISISISGQELNRWNIFHKFWHCLSNFLFKLFKISNLNLFSKLHQNSSDSKDYIFKIKLVKEVYNKITIFIIYFILSGIQWNWNLDKYRERFSKEAVSEVKFILFLLVLFFKFRDN